MANKTNTKFLILKSKTLFFILVFCLTLSNVSIAFGRSEINKKHLSGKTLRSIARIYMSYGEYEKAWSFAEQALILAKKTNASESELYLCMTDLAYLYKNQNKLADAEEMCKLGLKLQQKVLYEKHPYVAYTLRTLSSIYKEQGRFDEARAALDKAVDIMLDCHTEGDSVFIPFWVDIATLLVAQGDFETAEGYYQKAMPLINNNFGSDHLYTARVLTNIAEFYILQERYSEAETSIDRALAIQQKVYGTKHHLTIPALLIKAKICQAKEDPDQAEKLFQEALAAVEKTGNLTKIVTLKKRVAEIRESLKAGYTPVAKEIK
jgi:tetratricopeptide (TPR) repeat protein